MFKRFGLAALILCSGLFSLAAAQDRSVVLAYKTDTAPEIDGLIGEGEWDAAGPPIVTAIDDAGTNFPADPFGGPDDLSFQFRVMWEEPWMAYFLFEVTDDIAMEVAPGNAWEMDQIEWFMDGDDLEGSDDPLSFEWWNPDVEIYGKFGASRWLGIFEGHTGVMSEFVDEIFADEFGSFVAAAVQVTETGNNGDYVAEYAVSLEPMWWHGTLDGTEAGAQEKIVEDSTVVKWTVCVSDDDNFGDGTTGRSHTVCYFRDPPDADWRDSAAFADLTFVGPYTGDAGPQLKAGDANMDLQFDQLDLVQVQIASKYLTGQAATWGEGDWNGAPGGTVDNPPAGDGQFNQLDVIAALGAGTYLMGPYAAIEGGEGQLDDEQTIIVHGGALGAADLIYIPEPSAMALLALGLLSLVGWVRCR